MDLKVKRGKDNDFLFVSGGGGGKKTLLASLPILKGTRNFKRGGEEASG